MKNFIGVYENALDFNFCQDLIEKFNKSPHLGPGMTGHGVDIVKKNSTDINISLYSEWKDELTVVKQAVLNGMIRYVREYPFLLAGAVALQVQTDQGIEQVAYVDIPNLSDQSIARLIMRVYRLGSVNMQQYKQNEGGYFYWHSEVYPHPNDPKNDVLHRTLLWMFYLNDVDEGGETEFYFQNASISPRRGTLVIAPAGFTHTHRGNKPVSVDKYILTSWVLFNRSESLYGNPVV